MTIRFGCTVLIAACTLANAAALAADLPVKAPVKSVPYGAATNWSGFYAGGHLGGGWVDETATLTGVNAAFVLDPLGTSYNVDHHGVLGGVQAGYNYQVQNWVFGVGGDFSWTNADGESTTAGSLIAGSVVDIKSRTDWYATLTGRIGYAWNDVLAYGKGGVAWMHAVYGGYSSVAGNVDPVNDLSDTRIGWTVGAGLAWAFAPNWSVFGEYDYMDFGTEAYTFTSLGGATSNFDIKTTVHQAKFGVNYRF